MIIYLEDLKEITTLLASSHLSNNKNIMLYRNKALLINPSAKTTLLAWKTNKYVRGFLYEVCGEGDGCKTAVFILTSLLIGLNKLNRPYPLSKPVLSDKGIEKPTREDLEKIAPDLPTLIYEALLSNGTDIHISVEVGDKVDIEVIHSEGFIAKCSHKYEKEISLKGPMVVMYNRPVNKVEEIIPALENKIEGRPIVVVAPYFSKAVLDMITLNRNKGVIDAYALETPKVNWVGEWLKDLESFVGGELQNEFKKEFDLDWYGSAYEIKIKHNEVIFEQYEDKVELTSKRIDQLNHQAESYTSDLYFMREGLKERISALSGSLLRVKVGGYTEVEARNKRVQVEKSIQTLVSAIQGGVIREGLVLALYKLSEEVEDEIIRYGLQAPLRVIYNNTGLNRIEDLDQDKLRVPFPANRLRWILDKVFSIVNVWSSIEFKV